MTPVRFMCQQHLLGEWRELFAFVGSLKKQRNLTGYIQNDLFEPESLKPRALEISEELIRRGYAVKSFEMDPKILDYLSEEDRKHKIRRNRSLQILLSRCSRCRMAFEPDTAGRYEIGG